MIACGACGGFFELFILSLSSVPLIGWYLGAVVRERKKRWMMRTRRVSKSLTKSSSF